MQIGGKTGTTQNHSDGWFLGVTPQLTAGVWTGADLRSVHFRSIQSGQGAQMALPIWCYFMKRVLADPTLGINENVLFKTPAGYDVRFDCNSADETEKMPGEDNDFF
jgi:penicillin-binding protein 1A